MCLTLGSDFVESAPKRYTLSTLSVICHLEHHAQSQELLTCSEIVARDQALNHELIGQVTNHALAELPSWPRCVLRPWRPLELCKVYTVKV